MDARILPAPARGQLLLRQPCSEPMAPRQLPKRCYVGPTIFTRFSRGVDAIFTPGLLDSFQTLDMATI